MCWSWLENLSMEFPQSRSMEILENREEASKCRVNWVAATDSTKQC